VYASEATNKTDVATVSNRTPLQVDNVQSSPIVMTEHCRPAKVFCCDVCLVGCFRCIHTIIARVLDASDMLVS